MASFCKVIVMGTLGRDPDVRHTTGGTAVCEISLACNRTWKDKSGTKQESCDWIDCVLWGRQAEVCGEYCRKASQLLIEGRLDVSKWEKDGVKHQRMKVVCESMTMLGGSRRDSADQTPSSYSGEESQATHNGFDGSHATDPTGDVPF